MAKRDRMRFGEPDDAIAGAAQRRVHAKNHAVRTSRRREGIHENRRCHPCRRTGKALLHLFILPLRDAHRHMVPVQKKNGKQKAAPECPSGLTINPNFNACCCFGPVYPNAVRRRKKKDYRSNSVQPRAVATRNDRPVGRYYSEAPGDRFGFAAAHPAGNSGLPEE